MPLVGRRTPLANNRLYLRDATTTVGGTLPGAATQSAQVANVTATGASINRSLSTTIGTLQTSAALSTLAQTTLQRNWFRRFLSPALAAQTLAAASTGNSWGLTAGVSEANANSNFLITFVIYVWRPSTGALVGRFFDQSVTGLNFGSTTEVSTTFSITSGTTAQTVAAGDILVVEIWGQNTQGMATAYTNTLFYDGTTEASATTNAAYLTLGTTGVVFQGNEAAGPAPVANQAIKRSAYYMLGGLWRPEPRTIIKPEKRILKPSEGLLVCHA